MDSTGHMLKIPDVYFICTLQCVGRINSLSFFMQIIRLNDFSQCLNVLSPYRGLSLSAVVERAGCGGHQWEAAGVQER